MAKPSKTNTEALRYWRLYEELSILEAIALIAGRDPNSVILKEPFGPGGGDTFAMKTFGPEVDPISLTLTDAVVTGKIKTDIYYRDHSYKKSKDGPILHEKVIDWKKTRIPIAGIREWLAERGFKTGFFFPESDSKSDLDSTPSNYPPKLAAAIEVWKIVTGNPELLKGKTVKQAIIKWLRENASRFGLTKEDGSPNQQGIEEIAKIVNWNTKGGAPKTPHSMK